MPCRWYPNPGVVPGSFSDSPCRRCQVRLVPAAAEPAPQSVTPGRYTRQEHENCGDDPNDRRQSECHADRVDQGCEENCDQNPDHDGLLPLLSSPGLRL